MEEKIKYGMSPFWKDILWTLFWIGILMISIFGKQFVSEENYYGNFFFWIFRIFTAVILFVKIGLVYEEIGEECGVSFKIIKTGDSYKPYQVKVFRPRFIFLVWWWAPLDTKDHFFEGENIFGAKIPGSWSEEIEYEDEKEARKVIEKYKRSARITFKDYMSRSKKKIQRVIKV